MSGELFSVKLVESAPANPGYVERYGKKNVNKGNFVFKKKITHKNIPNFADSVADS